LLAKYFAGVTLLIIAILPTLVYYYSMHSLGNPVGVIDDGATFTSYIGLVLLGATFVSIGIFASSLTSNQIVAFILSMFLCWVFYDGLKLLGSFNLMGEFDALAQYMSLAYHYDSIKKGVIDVGDMLYFLTIIALFIYSALTVIKTLKR
jgi:ABC-2 type transport system permease protein